MWIIVSLAVHPGYASQSATESDLKAAFLFHFLKYVEWPDDRTPIAGSTYRIGVVEDRRVYDALLRLRGATVNGHGLEIVRLTVKDAIDDVHLLFVGAEDAVSTRALLERAASAGVLTVGNAPRFLNSGGMIDLRLVNAGLRFGVNLRASRDAELVISSRLLRLAVHVEGDAQGGR